jgi:hypothetical protein
VASELHCRLLAKTSIFSSESPIYIPLVDWLDNFSLMAILNSALVRYLLHTFLATRNHVEVGHVRRLPLPVLARDTSELLSALGRRAVAAAHEGSALHTLEREIDRVVAVTFGWSADQPILNAAI